MHFVLVVGTPTPRAMSTWRSSYAMTRPAFSAMNLPGSGSAAATPHIDYDLNSLAVC